MTLNCSKICLFVRKNWQSLLWESICIAFAILMLDISYRALFVIRMNWHRWPGFALSIVFLGAILCLYFSVILIGLTVMGKSESRKSRDRMGQFLGLLTIVVGFLIILIPVILFLSAGGLPFG